MAQSTYQIYPIYLGEIPVHDKSSFTYMVDMGKKMTCPFISFLLLGSNGRRILVDTGPCDADWGAQYHMPLNIPEGCELTAILKERFHLSPEDIDYLICTHLHWDHSCGNHKFPGKKSMYKSPSWSMRLIRFRFTMEPMNLRSMALFPAG